MGNHSKDQPSPQQVMAQARGVAIGTLAVSVPVVFLMALFTNFLGVVDRIDAEQAWAARAVREGVFASAVHFGLPAMMCLSVLTLLLALCAVLPRRAGMLGLVRRLRWAGVAVQAWVLWSLLLAIQGVWTTLFYVFIVVALVVGAIVTIVELIDASEKKRPSDFKFLRRPAFYETVHLPGIGGFALVFLLLASNNDLQYAADQMFPAAAAGTYFLHAIFLFARGIVPAPVVEDTPALAESSAG